MNGMEDDQHVLGPIRNLYDLYAKAGPTYGAAFRVDVSDIAGDTVIGRCGIKNWHGLNSIDFHELIKENGEWKITAKTCQQF